MAQSKQQEGQPRASREEAKSGTAADALAVGISPDNVPDQPSEASLKEADKVSGPYIKDAEATDEPVRSNRPDSPMIQTLKVGAGAHVPVSDPKIGPDGRFYPPGEYRDGAFYPHGPDGPTA